MKQLLIVLSISMFSFVRAQSAYEWVTAGQTMSMLYYGLEPHPDGGVIALAERSQLSYITNEIKFVQGDGTESNDWNLKSTGNGNILMRLDGNGKVIWTKATRSDYVYPYQLSSNGKGSFFLWVYIDHYDENDEGEPIGYLGDLNDDPMEEFPPGYAIVELNKQGSVQKVTTIPHFLEDADFDLYSLHAYDDGQFLIGGFMHDGKLVNNLEMEALGGGGEFVMKIDKDGVPVWGDVVSYRKNTCCSQTTEGSMVDVAPDGTIYMGGTYFTGGVFSNGKQTMAPGNYTGNKTQYTEAFVVSYSPEGKMNWFSVDQSFSRFHRLKATNDGVYIAHKIAGPKAFGSKVDTLDRWTTTLSYINTKGKTKWNKPTMFDKFDDIEVSTQGDILVCGLYKARGKFFKQLGEIDNLQMGERHDSFVVSLDPLTGKAKKIWSDNLLLSKERSLIAINDKDELFFSTEVFCSMSLDFNILDEKFPAIKCYGSLPMLARLKW